MLRMLRTFLSWPDWRLAAIVDDTMPPRDPNDNDDDEDEDEEDEDEEDEDEEDEDEEDEERDDEPSVVREPEPDE